MTLPDVPDTTKKTLAREAARIVTTQQMRNVSAYLITAFVENAQLTDEVNRLRAELGRELLPTYTPGK